MTTLPPPLPKPPSQWKQLPLAGKITLIIAGLALFGFFLDIKNPPTTATTTATSSDPCGLARRGLDMTREQCERIGAVQSRLNSGR